MPVLYAGGGIVKIKYAHRETLICAGDRSIIACAEASVALGFAGMGAQPATRK